MLSFDRNVAGMDIAAETRTAAGGGARTDRDIDDGVARELRTQAFSLAEKALIVRKAGDETTAGQLFGQAVAAALRLMKESPQIEGDLANSAAQWALDAGDVETARGLLETRSEEEVANSELWRQVADIELWPDAWLVAVVRRSPTDERALDVLARRYWKVLFGRCQMLTLKREVAADLAQDTWCRVLRARDKLLPSGNFRAYLLMIATNLWRDSKRAALRAGMLAADRMSSLEAERPVGDGPSVSLEETLPDLGQLEGVARERLKQDLDFALEQLDALSRDVLLARFLDGASCAEIGHRYGRTEQTASGWLRRALSELKICLEASRRDAR